MITTLHMTIAFKIPDEWEQAQKYAKRYPGWKRDEDTQYMYFTKTESWSGVDDGRKTDTRRTEKDKAAADSGT